MRLREVINNLQEEAWTSHKELANILYKHTGNKQLAIDFFHLETEFDSQDDMQSTGLSALDIDPFASDRERVNNILSINNVPVKVLKMKHNDAYETLYSLLQSAPVSESREELCEVDFKRAAAIALACTSIGCTPGPTPEEAEEVATKVMNVVTKNDPAVKGFKFDDSVGSRGLHTIYIQVDYSRKELQFRGFNDNYKKDVIKSTGIDRVVFIPNDESYTKEYSERKTKVMMKQLKQQDSNIINYKIRYPGPTLYIKLDLPEDTYIWGKGYTDQYADKIKRNTGVKEVVFTTK
jgi:hypothetical protein